MITADPIRLTSDETRGVIRCYQSEKPVAASYARDMNSLLELGLVSRVPMETPDARSARLASAWTKLRVACTAKDSDVAGNALKVINDIQRSEEPAMGYVLSELGKQVARGITVRITKR